MAKPTRKRPLAGDDKIIHATVRGPLATAYRQLLREEGVPELHHVLCAIEDYCQKKGYPKSV